MRSFATLAFVLGIAGSAAAQSCNSDVLALDDWAIAIGNRSGMESAEMALTYRSTADKPFRMIDASVRFTDVLGGLIGLISTERDMRLSPGEAFSEDQTYLGTQLNRMVDMERSDINAVLCTRAVVYEDGTQETFD
jgi:hypothetical protein